MENIFDMGVQIHIRKELMAHVFYKGCWNTYWTRAMENIFDKGDGLHIGQV